ncbi:uncharacterized protein LOC587327 [Strongylocentrotus purpuratus]|uniref:Uncharacterized protein n=1 Tax=Strongylocentrotus purpuratus TaxID=7668 RepID=A0A7M7RFX3_STRPU|nr:uncharacterized protein LOC587327 [Strongylocentrotus purpuratus]
MAFVRNIRRSLEFILQIVIIVSVFEAVWGQVTCASRRCRIQLKEGEAQDVTFPGSVDTVIDSLDEVRWTITASNRRNRIIFVIEDINWPKTDIKFEDQNPNQIPIRHEDKVFPIFPEYSTKVIKSGIFLSGTHSMQMEMDIPIIAELQSIPSFRMHFTAYTVKEVFRCKLSTVSCETESTLLWKQNSDGFVFTGRSHADEGALTVRFPQGTRLNGKGYVSFGYKFDYQDSRGMSGGQSRDEKGRVTVACPGRRNFEISSDGATQLVVNCDVDDASITFTAHGSLKLVIVDVDLNDASVSATSVDPELSSESSVLPVAAGISVFVGFVVIAILGISVFRRQRSQGTQERNPKVTVDKGHENNGFHPQNVRTLEDPDEGTYHYPSFPLSPPPRDGDTIYQEIEKKDPKGPAKMTKDGGDRVPGRNAYDLLELPGDGSLDSNKKTSRSTEKLSVPQGSPLLSRCVNRSLGYETLDGTTGSTSSGKERASSLITAKDASANETKQPTPARGECEYLEILPSDELESLKLQDKNDQPVLAHQNLYQHLERKDISFQTPTQGQTAEQKSSVGTDITEENYGKLDIAADSPPGGPSYFVLEANTDC